MSTKLVPFRTDGALTFNLLPEAVILRDSIIEKTKPLITVSDETSKALAVERIAALKSLVADCEACRVAEKAPAKEYGEKIDAQAKEFKLPAEQEIARIESAIGKYVTDQQEKARAQAQRLREEEQRKVREQAARDKELADAQRKVQEATNAEERLKAAEEAKRLAEAAEEAEMDAAGAEPPPPPVFINTKVAGAAVKRTPQIMVHDIHELYKAHPQCVTLKENLNAIKDLIKLAESQNKPINIPGVDVSFVTDVQVRKSSTSHNLLK